MSFVFSDDRAAQAAAHCLKRFPGSRLTRGKLIKLLYLVLTCKNTSNNVCFWAGGTDHAQESIDSIMQ